MYAKGQGVPKDEAEASKWFQMATDQRKALEAYNYGDFALALKTFRPLAEQGQVLAEYIDRADVRQRPGRAARATPKA